MFSLAAPKQLQHAPQAQLVKAKQWSRHQIRDQLFVRPGVTCNLVLPNVKTGSSPSASTSAIQGEGAAVGDGVGMSAVVMVAFAVLGGCCERGE
jgi:hypothetical protein